MSNRWTADDIPNQQGRTAVITGANSGIGFETAKELARHEATVVIACRDLSKAKDIVTQILAEIPQAIIETVRLDLSSLASIREAAEELRSRYNQIHLLINNAGIMWPDYSLTEDNFELQFGTNHLGHFALTCLLLDNLLHVPDSRIVTVSSLGHRQGKINFEDLQSTTKYNRYAAYSQSKLANLMFTYELQRRLAAAGAETIAVTAHPGGSKTNLMRHVNIWFRILNKTVGQFITQSPQKGALPTLRAAVDPNVNGNDYYGPDGYYEFTGYPKRVESNMLSHDVDIQHRLWEVSEQLTGVKYSF